MKNCFNVFRRVVQIRLCILSRYIRSHLFSLSQMLKTWADDLHREKRGKWQLGECLRETWLFPEEGKELNWRKKKHFLELIGQTRIVNHNVTSSFAVNISEFPLPSSVHFDRNKSDFYLLFMECIHYLFSRSQWCFENKEVWNYFLEWFSRTKCLD